MTPRSLVALSILFFVPCFTWCEDVTTVATLAAEKTTNAADAIRASTQLPATTPWNLAELSKPPEFQWTDKTSRVRQLTYAGEQHRGGHPRWQRSAYRKPPSAIFFRPVQVLTKTKE
jgi:hypothetical protein